MRSLLQDAVCKFAYALYQKIEPLGETSIEEAQQLMRADYGQLATPVAVRDSLHELVAAGAIVESAGDAEYYLLAK